MRKLIPFFLAILIMATGATTAHASVKVSSYRQHVLAGTLFYGPCKSMMKTRAGRLMYWDMVIDSTDDGGRRSVKAQIRYVKQGCRNGA